MRRLELVRKIIDIATTNYGIALEDIVIDPLGDAHRGRHKHLAVKTLETISLITRGFGLNMTPRRLERLTSACPTAPR